MKNSWKKITALMIAFLAIGCTSVSGDVSNAPSSEQASSAQSKSKSSSSSKKSSSSKADSSSGPHVHNYSSTWSYDDDNHWKACTGADCRSISDYGAHNWGEWATANPANLTGAAKYAYVNPQVRKCKICNYQQIKGTNILPELRFNFNKNDPNADFATKATKSDLSRPEVSGTYSLSNCPEQYQFSGVNGTMKVRGNQTAGWAKKAFRIKFDSKRSMMGLNSNGEYKKWVLLADAKDTALIRSAAGLYISKEICKDDSKVWVCDYTPVTVYLNDEYWGFYYLGEQKEVKEGRINLEEPASGYSGVDIGYCFELDHYADAAGTSDEASEVKKGKDGDPTFRMKYIPEMKQGRPSGPLAIGQVNTYTLLSDITDGPADRHVEADYTNVRNGQLQNNSTKTSNSNQLSFIRDKMEQLYQVLYYAAQNKEAREINESGQVVVSSKSVEEVMRQYFDINAWVDGYIINAFSVAPDLGYSSFYMSYDNTPSGDKKLRFDCPWDFDSNFGNRRDFYVNAEGDTYVNNTYNTWLYLLSKIDFFIDAVKVKWNALREAQVFENMFLMMRQYFRDYDGEIQRNHYKWPQNDAAHVPPNNFDEIRNPYKDPAQYKDAEAETISWCAKRVNFLEREWGTGRANVNTGA